jgi:hypothetical protein
MDDYDFSLTKMMMAFDQSNGLKEGGAKKGQTIGDLGDHNPFSQAIFKMRTT